MIFVKSAIHIKDYILDITFSDGSTKRVNLSSSLDGEIFKPLKDPSYFAKVSVNDELETICWPNGADFAPEYLYSLH